MRLRLIVMCGLLLASNVSAQDDDAYDPDMDMGEGGGSDYGGDDDYGGGDEDYGGEEPPPPPPADVAELTSVQEFDDFLDNNDASVVAAFTATEIDDPDAALPEDWDEEEDGKWDTPKIENPAVGTFKEIASSVTQYRWAYSSAPEVLAKLKSKNGGLYLYRSPRFVSKEHGDRPRERFPSASLSEATVSTWLADKAQPLVGLFSSDTKSRYLGGTTAPKQPVLVIFLNLDFDANAKGVKYVLKRARKVAVGLKGKLSIAVAALSDMTYELADYGLESKSSASILMGLLQRKAGKDSYYGSEAAFSEKALSAFAESFLAGDLTPNKVDDGSSPPPPPYDEDGEEGEADEADVVTLTSENFDEIVGDTSKDKLIEFYAPWCGHCKALAPEYARAATQLAEEAPNVVLAKMDATAHDPPSGYEVSGYPTLYFVKAGEGSTPTPYDGEREADAIVTFMKENAATSA
jgi:protein disulfide isomerase